MDYTAINLQSKFRLFSEHWSPKVVSELNDYQIKLVKLDGDFVWHSHQYTDELFLVVQGRLSILFRDGEVSLEAGEMFVVPKGVEHKPCAEQEVQLLLIEPRGLVNTGDVASDRTAPNDVWI